MITSVRAKFAVGHLMTAVGECIEVYKTLDKDNRLLWTKEEEICAKVSEALQRIITNG